MHAAFFSRFRRAATLLAGLVPIAAVGPLAGQTTVLSGPVGVMSARLDKHESPLAFPLIARDVFVGVAAGNSATGITFPVAAGNVGALLTSGGRYYVEVATGALEGERFDIDTDATIAAAGPGVVIDLADESFSTLSSLPDDVLAGARCVLRPHVTLATIQAMFSPALEGAKHGRSGDGVWILDDGDFDRYYLGEDGESWYDNDGRGSGRWSRVFRRWCDRHGWKHRQNPVDYRDLVVPPDVGVLVDLATGPRRWRLTGVVRTNAFRKNLESGLQALATGFPVALSPVAIGAFVDPTQPPGYRWNGDNQSQRADQLQVLEAADDRSAVYYLRGDGHTWQPLAGRWSADVSADPILGPADLIVVKRRNPDPTFVVPRPFAL